jgi:hypothetical protein
VTYSEVLTFRRDRAQSDGIIIRIVLKSALFKFCSSLPQDYLDNYAATSLSARNLYQDQQQLALLLEYDTELGIFGKQLFVLKMT